MPAAISALSPGSSKVEYRSTDHEGGFSRSQVCAGAGFRF
jgi:hypothetical protein